MEATEAREITRNNNSTVKDDNATYKDAIRVIRQEAGKGNSTAIFPAKYLIGKANFKNLAKNLRRKGYDVREELMGNDITEIEILW